MGTLNEKLDYLKQTKQYIKEAIIGKGQEISSSDTFRSYADKISAIDTVNNEYPITVTPTTSSQTVTPDQNHTGLSSVTVSAVDSTIDANITASNIKSGVEILGVEGTYEGQIPILQDKTITVNGKYTADEGYDGLREVTVDVASTSSTIPATNDTGEAINVGDKVWIEPSGNNYNLINFNSAIYSNFNVVGSPTVNPYTGEVSGFSSSNYLTLPQSLNPLDNHWEAKLKFRTSSNVTSAQGLFQTITAYSDAGQYGICLIIYQGKLSFSISTDGTSWLFDTSGTHNLSSNTTYWIKFGWTGTEYYLDYSTDGTNYTRDITENSTTPAYSSSNYTLLGIYSWRSRDSFIGTLDLSDCYITVNNSTWWNPEGIHITENTLTGFAQENIAAGSTGLVNIGTVIEPIINFNITPSDAIVKLTTSQTGKGNERLSIDDSTISYSLQKQNFYNYTGTTTLGSIVTYAMEEKQESSVIHSIIDGFYGLNFDLSGVPDSSHLNEDIPFVYDNSDNALGINISSETSWKMFYKTNGVITYSNVITVSLAEFNKSTNKTCMRIGFSIDNGCTGLKFETYALARMFNTNDQTNIEQLLQTILNSGEYHINSAYSNQYGGSFVLANAHAGSSNLYRINYNAPYWYNSGKPYEYVFETSDSELEGYVTTLVS